MTRNKNRLFGRHFETVQHFDICFVFCFLFVCLLFCFVLFVFVCLFVCLVFLLEYGCDKCIYTWCGNNFKNPAGKLFS